MADFAFLIDRQLAAPASAEDRLRAGDKHLSGALS
jgi:hypothetical protein